MPDPTPDTQSDQAAAAGNEPAASRKPIVIGLYGLPGSGKSFLLQQLKLQFGQEHFVFYEGSEWLADAVGGDLATFQALDEPKKLEARQSAIKKIGETCADTGKVAIVAGHFMFWNQGEDCAHPVWTGKDAEVYTHVIYLDVPAETLVKHRSADKKRVRPHISEAHLKEWQELEQKELRRLCYENCILFTVVEFSEMLLNTFSTLLYNFWHHTESENSGRAQSLLKEAISAHGNQLETVLVIDADKTLAAEDTGVLFWDEVAASQSSAGGACPLTTLFRSPMQYSHTAFRQAALLYEEIARGQDYDEICRAVASKVTVHPDFLSLLQVVNSHDHVGAVIVTCGLRDVWEKVLEREGLLEKVKVVGGGRIANNLTVTAAVKAEVVTYLKDECNMRVFAFGDSPLDLEMLSKAHRAIVVVGEESTRSKSMDELLGNAIDMKGLRASQALLPAQASPRLDTIKLPVIQLTAQEFVDSVLRRSPRPSILQIYHATDKEAAKVLATRMRDAKFAGPELREAHRRVGHYLAIEYLIKMIGLEPAPIHHVLGPQDTGSRLSHEADTTIVALMRGGEPMAFGVNDAFPLAMFVHAGRTEDLKSHHLQGRTTVILVDSVINTGESIVDFVERVRKLHAAIRILVVAGVVQAKFAAGNSFNQRLAREVNVDVVALRTSDTSFVGTKATDTGNRLFNSTHLP